ncbi:MAG: glucose-6-phosphate dehydrogenase [Bdellovibrionales bacterium]|nr:glucose-6-phosphate dehydrogenase [Bdellovibrionales bacterium]
MENPFESGENRLLRPPSTAMVIFGATGDLTQRKLLPALYNLAYDGFLPTDFIVIGASRTKLSDNAFREKCKASVEEHSRRPIEESVWQDFSKRIFYQPLHATEKKDFEKLRKRLEDISLGGVDNFHFLFYLATSPNFFGPIAQNLKAVELVVDPNSEDRRTILIVEKPFGHDLQSASELNRTLQTYLDEKQIYRIDHYLGKETVQNILVFRFSNGIFEPLWNRRYIDHIQISVCESIGVGTRSKYFDETGILRDIIQNHLLQVLSLLCIEPPNSLSDADSIRDEKVKVLRALKRFSSEDIDSRTVRGQYTSGFIASEPVIGYRQEANVAQSSQTETFAALTLEIENWRWAGVPIYIRAGKRLPKRITEISVSFKPVPHSLFRGRDMPQILPNLLTIQIQPREGISFRVNSKPPGPRMRANPVVMDFLYNDSYGVRSPEAYERLLLDAMKGDATLFTRNDEIEEAWSFLEPLLDRWSSTEQPVYAYEAGSWGPSQASSLLSPLGHRWRRL